MRGRSTQPVATVARRGAGDRRGGGARRGTGHGRWTGLPHRPCCSRVRLLRLPRIAAPAADAVHRLVGLRPRYAFVLTQAAVGGQGRDVDSRRHLGLGVEGSAEAAGAGRDGKAGRSEGGVPCACAASAADKAAAATANFGLRRGSGWSGLRAKACKDVSRNSIVDADRSAKHAADPRSKKGEMEPGRAAVGMGVRRGYPVGSSLLTRPR